MADRETAVTEAQKDAHRAEEYLHQDIVTYGMREAISDLTSRVSCHDRSKMEEPEVSGFARMKADRRLKDLTYGSDEYRAVLREHKATIAHHYEHNDHHPEHFENGIAGMTLGGIIEMLCDWNASVGRMKDGDLHHSILINADRFGYDAVFAQILINTADALGFLGYPRGGSE